MSAAARPIDDAEVSLVALIAVVLRHRRLVVGTALVLAGLVAVATLVKHRTWTSGATIVPQNRPGNAGALSGLAAQFGVAIPSVETTQSPAFYTDLLTSRRILGAVVDSGIAGPRGSRVSIAALYGLSAPTPALERDLAIRTLGQNVDAAVSAKTGVIELQVHAPNAVAAQELTALMLRELARFNVETRQSQAAAERRFTEKRLNEARGELGQAESELKYFLQRNRMFESPDLAFGRDRLQREVSLRQQIYSSLAQAFEQARIDEVRDTPVFTVVEAPEAPVRPDPRGLVIKTILALIGGSILGVVFAFFREFARRQAGASSADREELDQLLSDTSATARAPWRMVGRLFTSRH